MAEKFTDLVYPDGVNVARAKVAEKLIPMVADARQYLAETEQVINGAVQLDTLQNRMYGIDPAAVLIALRQASEANLLDFDEAMGEIYPARSMKTLQIKKTSPVF
jgi:hypothetical protein